MMATPTKMVFEEIVPKDLPTIYANSVLGGLGPRGDLSIILCREYPRLSTPTYLPIVNGKVEMPLPDEDATQVSVIREHVARLIIPLHQVQPIAEWLTQQANTLAQAMRTVNGAG